MTVSHPADEMDQVELSPEMKSLMDWVSSRTGLSFRNQTKSVFQTLRRCMNQAGDVNESACRRRLAAAQDAFDDLVGELTVGETYFFRDERHFELIRRSFFEEMRTSRPENHRLRLWSAGCASGEEAWSLAAVVAEQALTDQAHILATDVSRAALSRAQTARFGAWSMRGTARQQMNRWGKEQAGRFQVSDSLRPLVSFRYLNLAADQYPSFASRTVGMDLILCRNVLIYFDRDTTRKVAAQLYDCLSPGGWLISGPSDPPLADYAPFEIRDQESGQFYCRPESRSSVSVSNAALGKTLPETDVDAAQNASPGASVTKRSAVQPVTTEGAVAAVGDPGESKPGIRLNEISLALQKGEFAHVVKLTAACLDDEAACVVRVRALAQLDPGQAVDFCAEAIQRHRVCTELHYLHAMLLADLNRYEDAAVAARSVVFLDRNLAVGHLALGTMLQRIGELDAARRSFQNAKRLCERQPPDQPVPLADGEQAGRLAESASRHLALLAGPQPS